MKAASAHFAVSFRPYLQNIKQEPTGARQRVPVFVLSDAGPTHTDFLWSPARLLCL